MMNRDYVPTREAELVTFTNNFAEQLTAKFAQVGRTSQDATAFAALNAAWVASYATASNPPTRTKPSVQAKNTARRACVAKLRELAGLIQKFSGTTNELRADFLLPIPAQRSPIAIPTAIPNIEVRNRYGNTVVIRLSEPTGRRVMPKGVQGARVYTYVGPTAPTDPNAYFLEGQTTRNEVELQFDTALTPGTTVWITAAYYNPRGQLGPGATPISTVLAGGALNVSQGNLRIAA
jgi:hypothetical protein